MMAPREVKKAVRYIRVSRVGDRAGHESYGSPDDQRREIDRTADYKRIEIVGEHVDEDESGGTHDRPGLEAAIAAALSGKVDAIVCYDLSRFSRFTEGGLRDLRRLKEAGARLVFATEDIDTSTTHGKMIYTILLATHEAALDQHKARWRSTKARGIREGRQIGPTPFGFTRSRGDHGQLVPHATEGPIVTRAYDLAATEGLAAAVRHLQESAPVKSFTARKAASAKRYGVELGERVTVPATWNSATVRRLLTQRVYLGEAYYRYRDGEELLNPRAHEPLTDLATFTLAQTAPNGARAPAASFPLTGHVRCGSCGARMSGSRAGAGPTYRRMYKCTRRECSRRVSVSAQPLEALARELLIAHAYELVKQVAHESADPTDQRSLEALREAEERRDAWRTNDEERQRLGDAAHAAVLGTYEQAVTDAQAAYEEDLRRAVDPVPEPSDVHEAPEEELGALLERFGLVATVKPGRGNLEKRVSLEPAEES